MENTSVAEMRKKFSGAKIMGVHPGTVNVPPRKRSDDPSPPDEPRRGSASQSDEINPPIPQRIGEPVRFIPTVAKKPPVPLPKPNLPDRHDHPAAPDSYVPFDREVPHALPNIPLDPTGGKKAHISPPNTIARDHPTDYVNVTVEPPFSSASASSVLAKGISKLAVPLPTSAVLRDRTESDSNDLPSATVSLGEQLPSRCTFVDFDSMIDQYHKRDPQTIFYARNKPVIPKMTTNEINILQRLSNTHQ